MAVSAATDTHAYDARRRYSVCTQCGASVEIPAGSGTATCGYCRAVQRVRMLPEAAAAPPRAHNEAERRQLLAARDRRFFPPPDIAHLFVGQRVADATEAEARARWQQLRAALLSGDARGAEQFFVLSMGLAEACFERGDATGQRAVVDSALHAIQSPHHKQVLRAQVARSALRAGDPRAAEAWLAACDAASEDLLADTAYRFARAYLDTARGDHAAVIRVLGSGADVPFSDAFAAECVVLCANAWERAGQRALAVDALVAAQRDSGPLGRQRVQRFLSRHADWQLCAKSSAEAERRVSSLDQTPVEGGTIAGALLITMGLYALLWAASGAAMPALGFALGYSAMSASSMGFGLSVIAGGIVSPLGLFGIRSLVKARRLAALRQRGEPRSALILDCRQTGPGNDQRSTTIHLSLLITSLDAPAYHATQETSVQTAMLSNFAPGKILLARVQPGRAQSFTLEVL